jgi:hypothetical protein
MSGLTPIPPRIRKEIAADPFMVICIYESENAPNHDCGGRVQWEHAYLYGGKRINEAWSIVPCCANHNSGRAMVKGYNRYRAIIRADIKDLMTRYPKNNWQQELKYLKGKYEKQILGGDN